MESLQSKTNERWRGLCELALSEHDAEKLEAILAELNSALEERDRHRRNDLPKVSAD